MASCGGVHRQNDGRNTLIPPLHFGIKSILYHCYTTLRFGNSKAGELEPKWCPYLQTRSEVDEIRS